MRITVLYFAAVRDLVGLDREIVDLPAGVDSIASLAMYLEQRHPGLSNRLKSVRFARNELFVSTLETIAPGDVIALIPPVAGG